MGFNQSFSPILHFLCAILKVWSEHHIFNIAEFLFGVWSTNWKVNQQIEYQTNRLIQVCSQIQIDLAFKNGYTSKGQGMSSGIYLIYLEPKKIYLIFILVPKRLQKFPMTEFDTTSTTRQLDY